MGPTIYLLIGPKGSGKTFIGSLLEERLGIRFLRVEDIALRVKGNRTHQDASYVSEVFAAIEAEVRRELSRSNELCFESSGLSEPFDRMLRNLQQGFRVHLLRIRANSERCLERVRTRDSRLHVAVSDDHVAQINAMVEQKQLPWTATIDNDNDNADPETIVNEFTAGVGRGS